MDATPTDAPIDATANETSSPRNRAVPPPIPAAARVRRVRVSPTNEIHTLIADHDVVCLDDERAEPRMLTFPPSPPVPGRERHIPRRFDWKLFGVIVTLSSVSLAAAASTGWISHERATSPRAPSQLVIEAKRTARLTTSMSLIGTPSSPGEPRSARVAATPAPVPSVSLLPEVPMAASVAMAEQRVRGAMMVCGMGVPNASPTVRAELTYSSDGSVRHIDLSAPWDGTEPGRCMEHALRSRAIVPPFRAETFRVTFSFQAQ